MPPKDTPSRGRPSPVSALASVMVFAGLTACTLHAPLRPIPQADPAVLSLERTTKDAPRGEWPARQWWTTLGDAQLSALIEEGMAASPDMETAIARLEAAQARASVAHAPLIPSLDANVNAQRSRLSENGIFPPPLGGQTLWQNKASLDLRWDLDFWGRQRSALTAAVRERDAAVLSKDLAELTLSSTIARRYIEWQRLEDQLEIARGLVRERESLLSLTQKRVDAGLDSNVQLRSAEAAAPDARADVLALETQVSVARIELAALIGAGPDRGLDLQRPKIASPALSGTPTLLPADLLGRRTDITAQRLRAQAAASRADAAKADLYPNINLAATVGLDSTTFEHWAEGGSLFYNAGPAINLPLFDGGAKRATLKLRTAEYNEAVAAYRQTLLNAVRDVAGTLTELRSLDPQLTEANAAVNAQTQAFAVAQRRYDNGLGAYTEVLLAEAQLLNSRRRVADLNARKLDASIRLVAALGGGLPSS